MNTKYATRLIMRLIVLATTIFLFYVIQATVPVMYNEIAMTQINNSNEYLILSGMVDKIMPVTKCVCTVVIVWFTYTTARETNEIINENNKEI